MQAETSHSISPAREEKHKKQKQKDSKPEIEVEYIPSNNNINNNSSKRRGNSSRSTSPVATNNYLKSLNLISSSSSLSLLSNSRTSRSSSRRSSRHQSPHSNNSKKNNNNNNNNNGKKYDSHIPVFPSMQQPTNIILEPFPNRRVRSMCTAGGLLVTAHRNGIRVYRQRYLSPSTIIISKGNFRNNNNNNNIDYKNQTDIRTGIWESIDFRDNFNLQDAYMCVSAEYIFQKEKILPIKWNRYVAVACGSDRTRFSVCVFSTAAHFLLHHELHSKNKVVAIHFALIAMDAKKDTRNYQPFVVSVDEVGEVVIYDIERDKAVKVITIPSSYSSSPINNNNNINNNNVVEVSSAVTTPTTENCNNNNNNNNNKSPSPQKFCINNSSSECKEDNANDNEGINNNNNIKKITEHYFPLTRSMSNNNNNNNNSEPQAYRLESGLATNVCLLGPCQVLCKHCNSNNNNNINNINGIPLIPGGIILSLFISSRAHNNEGQAELHVQQLRVYFTFHPPRAILISETPIIRECAPEDICDIGVGMLQIPNNNKNIPPQLLIARPRLRFWSLTCCTGKLLQLHRIYYDTDGSGKGARSWKEYFVKVIPLGRQVILNDLENSWNCVAALTDDDVILLLGHEPLPVVEDQDKYISLSKAEIIKEKEIIKETYKEDEKIMQRVSDNNSAIAVAEREALEAWLEDIESPKEEKEEEEEEEEEAKYENNNNNNNNNKEIKSKESEEINIKSTAKDAPIPLSSPPLTFMDPNQDYTVLMILTDPGSINTVKSPRRLKKKNNKNNIISSNSISYTTRHLISLPQSNELLFSIGETDVIYSIKLPFVANTVSMEAIEKNKALTFPNNNNNTAGIIPSTTSKKNNDSWMGFALNAGYSLDLNITRPLISAVWNFAGEVEIDETSLPHITPPPPVLIPPQEENENENKEDKVSLSMGNEERASSYSRAIVNVHIDNDGNTIVRKKKRRGVSIGRSCSNNNINSCRSSTMSVEDRSYIEDDDEMRKVYIENERYKFLESHHWNNSEGNNNNNNILIQEREENDNNNNNNTIIMESSKDTLLLTQLITMDEPLQRNTIMYDWSDEHDALYVQFTEEGIEINDKYKQRNFENASAASLQLLHQQSLRDHFIVSDFSKGNQSAGFMRVFREAQRRRQQLKDFAGIFNVESYFKNNNIVPQRVLDLQEDDRCRFELADLKASFEDDMKNLNEFETIIVFENEERYIDNNGRRRWVPHRTFHYDDMNGEVVDMKSLNATATIRNNNNNNNNNNNTNIIISTSNNAGGWRWATSNEIINTEGNTNKSSGLNKIVRKEISQWRVGEWMYAERWPTREEEMQGTFQWNLLNNNSEISLAKVRRRQLSRDRINIAIEAEKEERHRQYMQKMEKLRRELGL